MTNSSDSRSRFSLPACLPITLFALVGMQAAVAQVDFLDEFDGPDLAEGWTIRDENSPEAHPGFTGEGTYEVNEPTTSVLGHAGLKRPVESIESFTVDLYLHFEDFQGSNSDFKFRFFGGKFVELVYNSFDDIRVYSAERGGNINRINRIGITDDTPLHFRFTWDAEIGKATYLLFIDGGEPQEIASTEGLMEFTPNVVDVVMFKFGEGNGNTPKMFLDRFEVKRGLPQDPDLLDLAVSSAGGDLLLEWGSRPQHFYQIRTTTDPSLPAEDWELVEVEGSTDIAHSAPLNTLSLPRPADTARLYRVEEFESPPFAIFSENFDGDDPGWTTGFNPEDTAEATTWSIGDPAGGPFTAPSGAFSGMNCYGTNILGDHGHGSSVWLRTPAINLTGVTEATLTMMQWVDIDNFEDRDLGTIRVLAVDTGAELAVVEPGITGFNTEGWEEYSTELPPAALGQEIVLEFLFQSDSEVTDQPAAGWYLDDVTVTIPAP